MAGKVGYSSLLPPPGVPTLGHMRTVLMVLFDGAQSLDVTGPLEVFTGANTWRTRHGGAPAYDIRTASIGGEPVRTSNGLRVTPDEDLRQFRPRPDLLIVPGEREPGDPARSSPGGCGRTAAGRTTWSRCARAPSCSRRPACSTGGG